MLILTHDTDIDLTLIQHAAQQLCTSESWNGDMRAVLDTLWFCCLPDKMML